MPIPNRLRPSMRQDVDHPVIDLIDAAVVGERDELRVDG